MRLTSIRLAPPPPTTRTGFLDHLLSPFLGPSRLPSWLHPTPPPPTTLHEILLTTKALVQHVDQLNVFDMERVRIRLEPSPSGEPNEVELVLGLREKGRVFLKAGTEFGANEGGGVSDILILLVSCTNRRTLLRVFATRSVEASHSSSTRLLVRRPSRLTR